MTHTVEDESSSMLRLAGPGVAGESSGTAPGQSVAENADDNGLRPRPGFEEACLEAVEDFRRGRVDRTTVTTRVALAISNDCILSNADEQSTYQIYFSILDCYKNELHTVSSQTQADRALAFSVATEDHARKQGTQDARVAAEKQPQRDTEVVAGSAKHA